MSEIIFLTDDETVRDAAEAFLRDWNAPGDYITAHTSGSTGAPKPIQLSKSDMRASACATNSCFGIDSDSVLLMPLSASYIAGKMMIVRALESGCRLAVCTPSNRFWEDRAVRDFASHNRIRLLPVVPSQLEALAGIPDGEPGVDCSGHLLHDVDHIIIGGAPLSPMQERQLAALESKVRTRFHATFGMTEACSHVALRKIGSDTYSAMPGITFATDADECLRIMAPEFSFGTLQTNDRVALLSPTTFRWLGRRDNVVISGGIKLHPEQIERRLADMLPFGFYLTGIDDKKWGQALCIVVEEKEPMSDSEISQRCRILEPLQRPRMILRVKRFCYTSSGKLLRRPTGEYGCEARPLHHEARPSDAD